MNEDVFFVDLKTNMVCSGQESPKHRDGVFMENIVITYV